MCIGLANGVPKEMMPQEALDRLDKKVIGDLELKIVLSKALEKQIPKKVTHEATLYKCCTCPHCKNVVDKFEKWGESTVRITFDYCHFCGQALDWEDEE